MRFNQISPFQAKSIEPAFRLFAVPIQCSCIAPINEDRSARAHPTLAVRVNGLMIEDAEISMLGRAKDTRYAEIEFTGTIAVFAQGLTQAIDAASLPRVEFVDSWVEGLARQIRVEITGEVMMMLPESGRKHSRVGVDR